MISYCFLLAKFSTAVERVSILFSLWEGCEGHQRHPGKNMVVYIFPSASDISRVQLDSSSAGEWQKTSPLSVCTLDALEK